MHKIVTRIREDLGLNKVQLAAALECSPAKITRLENGEQGIGPELMARLWELCPEELRPALADTILEVAGVPVVYIRKLERIVSDD